MIMPESSNPAARSITVSLAPSLAGSLLGALDFLTDYPYGCTEQTLSSFLPNLLVTRSLTALKIAPTERLSALDKQVSAGVQRLYDFQHDDGGWGWWKGDGNHPFMTAYALWGLDEARRAGIKVETRAHLQRRARARALVSAISARGTGSQGLRRRTCCSASPPSPRCRGSGRTRRAFTRMKSARTELWDMRGRMSAYGRALLLLVLDEAKDARGNQLASELIAEAQTRGDLSWWPVRPIR